MRYILKSSIALIFFLCLSGCGENSSEIKAEDSRLNDDRIKITQAQFDQKKMKLEELTETTFPSVIKVNGMIDVPPENRAVVSATMGGYIKNTPLLIGDQVKKGQLLVTLENPDFISMQQEYMDISGQLTYLKSVYNRQSTLVAEKISSEKSFLKAESDYKSAFAKYSGLRKQLTMLNISPTSVEKGAITSVVAIYSPIAGSITKVNVTKGTYVSPATAILEIIDNDHIHLELSVFEKDIMKVKEGQVVDFKIPESSNDIFTGEVHLVGTSIDQNRTIKVHAHLENDKETNFLTGMFVEAAIITSSKKGMGIPSSAIVDEEDNYFVLALNEKVGEDYYFDKVSIQTNEEYNGNNMVLNANIFAPNTQFLTKGAFSLLGE